jgi:hypothetical protein
VVNWRKGESMEGAGTLMCGYAIGAGVEARGHEFEMVACAAGRDLRRVRSGRSYDGIPACLAGTC